MQTMKCQIQGHNGKELNSICLDRNCKNKGLCCLLCIKSFHSSHLDKLVDFNEMNTFIQQQSQKQVQAQQSCSQGQKQVIQGLEQLSNLIDSLQKIVMGKIQIMKQQNLQEYLQKISKMQQGIQECNQFLEGILQFVEIDNCLIKLTTSDQGKLNQEEQQLINVIKQSEQSLQIIINQFNPQQIQIHCLPQLKINRLCFKENRKHKNITIVDECTIKNDDKYFQRFSLPMAFAHEGFDPSKQSYAFSFNIQKIGYWVMVGVGNDEGIKDDYYLNFHWTLGHSYQMLSENNYPLGHGQYMLRNNNSTFHHTDKTFNDKKKGMEFKSGDKIQIRYDHLTKSLEFRKNQTQNAVVKMPITDMTKVLYPCVVLGDFGDQVQLAQY